MIRTTRRTVEFARAFTLDGYAQTLPPGSYVVETEEEPIPGLSFEAYRRVATTFHVDRPPGRPGELQRWSIEPATLEAALLRDSEGEDAAGAATDIPPRA
jgi:hypothetical protein